ncbi:glycosyltransferase family 4 protein [Bacillus infantis]|uniref:glycosyltransferase family 4 protein n=1 Tax=Bacillus infantis TaxID=324767 RepID=UPI003982510D
MKKKILILAGYYIPGVKGGGPIQSIKNLVDNLNNKFDFYILANDRDLGDEQPFKNVIVDEWTQVGHAKVYYTNYDRLNFTKISKIINSLDFDTLYLNSFFSYKLSVIPILLNKLKKINVDKVIIAPRGGFSQGALKLKKRKKNFFIKLGKIFSLYKNVIWHVTANTEKKDIEEIFGTETQIIVANNLTASYQNLKYNKKVEKNKGELKIVFVSRIHPKKNLKTAIEFLQRVDGKVKFDIYGPLEDKNYWSECERLINGLPENIMVTYKGIINHDYIIEVFKENHVFLFPTLGENFGHVISEALIGGCPVIISDQTPWINIEKYNAGWDISLKDEGEFIRKLQFCVDLDTNEYQELSIKAFEYGKMKSNAEINIVDYVKLFG